jgi:hypothetical protein
MAAIAFVPVLAWHPLSAQDAPEEKGDSELAALQARFEAQHSKDVLQPHEVAMVDLNTKYIASLERALANAQKAGKLDDALAAKGEIELLSTGKRVPPEDDAIVPESLKQLRETYRVAAARHDAERAKRTRTLQDMYATALDALVIRLTKEGKFDEALAARQKREQIAKAAAHNAIVGDLFGGGYGKGITVAPGAAPRAASSPVTEAQLVAKTWKHLVPTDNLGPSVYTFKDDHTVTSSKGNKGTWSVKDNVLRIEMTKNGFWVEISLQPDPAYANLTLRELDSSRGKRPNTVMTQNP